MSAPIPRWTLRSVRIRDLLGFQGEKLFEFGPGFQVIEAGNHTGKSSLAMGLLWGFTGKIPALDRLNLQSYRLYNRHAGESPQAGVVITLEDSAGRRMEIRRSYVGRTKGAEDLVELSVGDEELTGLDATERILLELGVGQSSLEGCGVVLQDHRLKLITGSDIGEVINDMLGLEALSEVVPMLEAQSKEAEHLRKEIDAFLSAGSPLQRWNEESNRLAKEYEARENRALKRGFDPAALENPDALAQAELAELARELELDPPAGKTSISAEVERQRKQLGAKRTATPLSAQVAGVVSQRLPFESAAKRLKKLAKAWTEHDEAMSGEAGRGELDLETLGRTVAECDEALARIKAQAEEKEGIQKLLEVAYQHLLEHRPTDTCPLCESKIDGSRLGAGVRARIDAGLATELERLAAEEAGLKAKKKKAEKRRTEVREIKATQSALMQDTRGEVDALAELGVLAGWALNEKSLLVDSAARAALIAAIERSSLDLGARVASLREQEAALQEQIKQQEETVFQPLEARLNRVREDLVPLLEAVVLLEEHAKRRDVAEQRSGELDAILRDARETAGRLKKIAVAVSEVETERATAAVKARLPVISEFFANVAGNPDFTGLAIETGVSRGKVGYTLRATSSRMAALGDAVGHVLSEGDMSAAGMALLLGLASGESHRLGFLLLDDPAQGMDPTLQKNFARELARFPHRPQVIILTHQPEFAFALAEHGAERTELGRWAGGRVDAGA